MLMAIAGGGAASIMLTGTMPAEAADIGAEELSRARYFHRMMDAENALIHFNKAAAIHADDPQILYERGINYKDLDRFDLAVEDISKAIRLNPKKIEYYEGRARIYDMTGKLKEAIADYNSVLQFHPDDWSTWSHRGLCYRRLKEYKPAAHDFQKALDTGAHGNQKQKLMYYVAEMLMAANDTSAAFNQFNKVIAAYPDLSGAYWGRAKIYDKLGKTELAEKDRQKARKIDEEIDPLIKL